MVKRFRFGGKDLITNPNPNYLSCKKHESEYSGFWGKDLNPNPNIRENTGSDLFFDGFPNCLIFFLRKRRYNNSCTWKWRNENWSRSYCKLKKFFHAIFLQQALTNYWNPHWISDTQNCRIFVLLIIQIKYRLLYCLWRMLKY